MPQLCDLSRDECPSSPGALVLRCHSGNLVKFLSLQQLPSCCPLHLPASRSPGSRHMIRSLGTAPQLQAVFSQPLFLTPLLKEYCDHLVKLGALSSPNRGGHKVCPMQPGQFLNTQKYLLKMLHRNSPLQWLIREWLSERNGPTNCGRG